MHELRSPKNPTKKLLELEPVLNLDAKKSRKRFKRALRGRKRRGSLGSRPRRPAAVMAAIEREMLAVTGSVNVALLEAIRPLLKGDGVLSSSQIRDAIRRVKARVPVPGSGEAKAAAIQNLQQIERFNRRDVHRAIGVPVPEFSAPIGEKWQREHVALIKSLGEEPKARALAYLREAGEKQTRVETIQRWLEVEEGVSKRRARLIARDQVLTLNAKLNQDRQERAGITEYVWRSVGDSSSRSHHKQLDGKRFKYSDPPIGGGTGPSDPGHPGTGIGCRCQAIPVIPEFDDENLADATRKNPLAFSTSETPATRAQKTATVS